MKTDRLALTTLRLKNFKAIQDSGEVVFTPLTVFIGNNGSGKSSLIEGLETLQQITDDGLDKAMRRWHGFEYVRNITTNSNEHSSFDLEMPSKQNMSFQIAGSAVTGLNESKSHHTFTALTEVEYNTSTKEISFLSESLTENRDGKEPRIVTRTKYNTIKDLIGESRAFGDHISPNESILSAETSIHFWQFNRLNPDLMGEPVQRNRVPGERRLETDGSNIADFILDMSIEHPGILNEIIELMQAVLPYATEVQLVTVSDVGLRVYMQLVENGQKIPGWLFSTGTLRVLALLALLRHPNPPPLIVIEEIENGLDPRTIHMLVEELRYATENGLTQIIITTHSPYLLDLLLLDHIILVERENGHPVFRRPSNNAELQSWSAKFAPGKLYTMGKLTGSIQ